MEIKLDSQITLKIDGHDHSVVYRVRFFTKKGNFYVQPYLNNPSGLVPQKELKYVKPEEVADTRECVRWP